MTELVAGFVLGLSGSAHCALMCGPLVLALHRGAASRGRLAAHHLGRVAVYAVAGFAAGTVGAVAGGSGFGRMLAVSTGVILVLSACRQARTGVSARFGAAIGQRLARLAALATHVTPGSPHVRGFALGALNGLLPCGMIYTALTASLALGGGWRAAVFMGAFGVGTLPALAAVLATLPWLSNGVATRLALAGRLAVALLGVALIAQGLGAPAVQGETAHGGPIPLHLHHLP
jgi:uncharacterized protein